MATHMEYLVERRIPLGAVVIVLPGYLILGGAELAAFKMDSEWGVVVVALVAAGLSGILYAEFSRLRFRGGGIVIEAHRNGQIPKHKKPRRAAKRHASGQPGESDASVRPA